MSIITFVCIVIATLFLSFDLFAAWTAGWGGQPMVAEVMRRLPEIFVELLPIIVTGIYGHWRYKHRYQVSKATSFLVAAFIFLTIGISGIGAIVHDGSEGLFVLIILIFGVLSAVAFWIYTVLERVNLTVLERNRTIFIVAVLFGASFAWLFIFQLMWAVLIQGLRVSFVLEQSEVMMWMIGCFLLVIGIAYWSTNMKRPNK